MGEILELLRGLPYGGISFAALVSLAIILIFKGEIVPKSTLEAMRSDRDAIIMSKNTENDTLREAFRISEEARRIDAAADKELLELGRTTVQLLQAINKRANGANE